MNARVLSLGEPFPLVHLPSNRNPSFAIGSMGGRFVLFCVALDIAHADTRAAIALLQQTQTDEGVRVAALIAAAPGAEADADVAKLARTHIVLHDPQRTMLSEGRIASETDGAGRWILLDPTLRLIGSWPMAMGATALGALNATPPPEAHAGVPLHAPVLIVPRVFEPQFCQRLIEYYETNGGQPSGTTRENEGGKTYTSLDPSFKKREDCQIEDAKIRDGAMQRIFWRLLPQVERAFMWRATRMERYIVACYDSTSGGFFRPHRDNTTKGTAHRRFAVTINLNAEDYDGGDLRFPEFGSRTYRAPTGGAVVFGCALLHEATPVTRGRRFAFLPFIYDEEDSAVRVANNAHLDDTIGQYRG